MLIGLTLGGVGVGLLLGRHWRDFALDTAVSFSTSELSSTISVLDDLRSGEAAKAVARLDQRLDDSYEFLKIQLRFVDASSRFYTNHVKILDRARAYRVQLPHSRVVDGGPK